MSYWLLRFRCWGTGHQLTRLTKYWLFSCACGRRIEGPDV